MTTPLKNQVPATRQTVASFWKIAMLALCAVMGITLLGGCHSHKDFKTYDAGSNGQTITIREGEMFSLRMVTNIQIKARWEVVDIDTNVVQQQGEPMIMGNVPVGGLARIYSFNYMFHAVGEGTSPLSMKLVDPDSGELLDSYSSTIVVKAKE